MVFLRGLDGLNSISKDPVKTYMINGSWSEATIKHYNAGVSKLIAFAKEKNIPQSLLLPVDQEVLYEFVVWAGPKLAAEPINPKSPPIKSNTI